MAATHSGAAAVGRSETTASVAAADGPEPARQPDAASALPDRKDDAGIAPDASIDVEPERSLLRVMRGGCEEDEGGSLLLAEGSEDSERGAAACRGVSCPYACMPGLRSPAMIWRDTGGACAVGPVLDAFLGRIGALALASESEVAVPVVTAHKGAPGSAKCTSTAAPVGAGAAWISDLPGPLPGECQPGVAGVPGEHHGVL